MNWSQPVDLYCERLDPSFWAEPLNAFTNLSFLIAAAIAFVQWRRAGGLESQRTKGPEGEPARRDSRKKEVQHG